MTTTLRTVIIPAAGRGTRLMPATRVTAKEMLSVYDRPVIEFAVEEAIEAQAERIIVVISPTKTAIRDHLAGYPLGTGPGPGPVRLVSDRARPGRSIPEIVYAFQPEPRGLGDAVLCCRDLVLPGPFGVILPDDIIMGRPCLSEMIRGGSAFHAVAAMRVQAAETGKYGIFRLGGSAVGRCIPVTGMVEKPEAGLAPSTLAAVGRYILEPMIFDVLQHTPRGAGGEVQLTDAIAIATHAVPLTAFLFSGERFDCGNHDGLLAASMARQCAVKTALLALSATSDLSADAG